MLSFKTYPYPLRKEEQQQWTPPATWSCSRPVNWHAIREHKYQEYAISRDSPEFNDVLKQGRFAHTMPRCAVEKNFRIKKLLLWPDYCDVRDKIARRSSTLANEQWLWHGRSEEHTHEIHSLMRNSYDVIYLTKK